MLSNTKRRVYISIIVILSIISTFFVYVGVYYHTDEQSVSEYISGIKENVEENHLLGDVIAVGNTEGRTAFIFYPGGKVENTAYLPLMYALAKEGILCLLVDMPFRLAIFDADAAEKLFTGCPGVTRWYIGGHSLGGTMAAYYASKNADRLDGVVLLGSYSPFDLSKTKLRVLSIYGSEDNVLNQNKYISNRSHYPIGFKEQIIDGGCHAYFGMYGKQRGDGNPIISNVEQIDQCASIVLSFIEE